ncbi:RNA polymerase sigma factor [Paenibacillus lemnae]|uniref:Sigma-70 family RNA polymerase sigma factor n=1 Tax=Paenibacillus lemnae TaxID=1330551 RepID=A0A848M970_PAELE|nr:sigma-70 family RNA polymerase sigma factor [Paenibacillus lemnae]NMO96433.1 sigma-70 family RNA polymerase sigma factor [Paenibacillus lemnae]
MRSDLYTELFKQHQPSLYLYLYRMCGSREIAEELVQETFYRAMISMKAEHREYARAWLYKVARHLFIDWFRKRRGEVQMQEELSSMEPENVYPTPEEALSASERQIRVARGISRMPESYQSILLLREMDGLSYKELGEVLELSPDQVKVTLYRARERFKREMMAIEGAGEDD